MVERGFAAGFGAGRSPAGEDSLMVERGFAAGFGAGRSPAGEDSGHVQNM